MSLTIRMLVVRTIRTAMTVQYDPCDHNVRAAYPRVVEFSSLRVRGYVTMLPYAK